MNDGNKESTKELLSTLRTIIALSLSLLIFSSNRTLFPISTTTKEAIFAISFASIAISIAVAIYVCLVVIRKLHAETENIIEQVDVQISSLITILLFVVGAGLLITIQNI